VYGEIQAVHLGGVSCPVGTWPKIEAAEELARSVKDFLVRHGGADSLHWVNACALGSRTLDDLEARILARGVGRNVPVSSQLGAFGSFLCSSSLRLAASLIALREGFIPPTVGLADATGNELDLVQGGARRQEIDRALVHTLADGGAHALTLVS